MSYQVENVPRTVPAPETTAQIMQRHLVHLKVTLISPWRLRTGAEWTPARGGLITSQVPFQPVPQNLQPIPPTLQLAPPPTLQPVLQTFQPVPRPNQRENNPQPLKRVRPWNSFRPPWKNYQVARASPPIPVYLGPPPAGNNFWAGNNFQTGNNVEAGNNPQAESSRQAESRHSGEKHPPPAIDLLSDRSTFWRGSDSVYVLETGTSRDLGVFALRNLPEGEVLILEPPAFSCPDWNNTGRQTVADEWLKLTFVQRDNLHQWFRKVRDVAHGGKDTFKSKDRKTLEKFMSEYAFADPHRGQALIYRWASTINHACESCANAKFWVDDREPSIIHVQLVRDVTAHEEIFICYNKPNLKFGCAVCGVRPSLKHGKVWAFIANIWRRRGGIKWSTSPCNRKGKDKDTEKDRDTEKDTKKVAEKDKVQTVQRATAAGDAMSTITEESAPKSM